MASKVDGLQVPATTPGLIDIANYADKNTLYMVANNMSDSSTAFEQAPNALFEWFQNKLLKSYADKCHLLVITYDSVSINVAGYK